MQENYELVQKGFRVLHPLIAGYIGLEMNREYRSAWWDEVLYALNDQRDLPERGDYNILIDSLDIANCLRLIDRKWNDVFRNELSINYRTWAKELMGVRNEVAHIGQNDLEKAYAERALDTMALLCGGFDEEGAAEIRELYNIVRQSGESSFSKLIDGPSPIDVPSKSRRIADFREGSGMNLLKLIGTDSVQKTTLTRKVTFAGKTQAYPVYKVRLDALYYNDQNDRIATWITRYRAENGADSLTQLSGEEYNNVIENFIYESNPESIVRTQKNISLVGQREPGVALSDGRIVDGNRRYTCLRRIQRSSVEPVYFETVIMDVDIQTDKKQIKLLELAIQHGEEKKIDYDLIDYAVGTYRDIVQTELLTVEEYANSTNEPIAEVKKRIEIAGIICEFLEYLKLPEQYHIAREYQVYSLFQEMLTPLRLLNDKEKKYLKEIAFMNAMMKAIPDQRKFIRDIKGIVKNKNYDAYFDEQKKWAEIVRKRYDETDINSKEDIDRFAEANSDITSELQLSMEKALQTTRLQILKSKPEENIAKCINLMLDVDSRYFSELDEEEKENIKAGLEELARIVDGFQRVLSR